MKTARFPRKVARTSVRCSPTASHESVSVRSNNTYSRSGCSRRETLTILEAHGLPVPHAYGLCDDPYALVMDRLPGFVDLSFAADDDERERLVDDYLDLLARIYAIPLDAAEAAGFAVPADSAATGLAFL